MSKSASTNSFKKTKSYSFDIESPIKKLSKSLNKKNMISILVLLFVAGGIATLIFLLINNTNNNDDKDDI